MLSQLSDTAVHRGPDPVLILVAVENFDILITSSFNENGGVRGSEQEKKYKNQNYGIFSHFRISAIPTLASQPFQIIRSTLL